MTWSGTLPSHDAVERQVSADGRRQVRDAGHSWYYDINDAGTRK
jgi:hypothetical protein